MSTRTQTTSRRRPTGGSITRLPREVITELRRVTWPSREEAVRLTIMVLIVSAVVGLFLGGVDYVFNFIMTEFIIGV